MKKNVTLFVLLLAVSLNLAAQPSTEGFASVTRLNTTAIHTNLGDQPQSKVWYNDGFWWAVMPETETGTHIWKLEGNSWNKILNLSPSDYTKADCKVSGNLVHALLFRSSGLSTHFVSAEYDPVRKTYNLWSARPSRISLEPDPGVKTATIELDKNNRMWLATNGNNNIYVRWSDPPYENWSAPITLAQGVNDKDICAVIAMPALNKIGVLWSNQNTRRFGFKTHIDGSDPTLWSTDEVPASQSAINSGDGMADDHLNMAIASDGTLYCAIKTGYRDDNPRIALLVRRPSGTWDNLYAVSQYGNRPIVILNEKIGKIKVVYAATNAGGINYKESSTANIAFSNELPLINESCDYATSSKDNYTQDIVIFASTNKQAFSVLATDNATVTSVDEDNGPDRGLLVYPNPFTNKVTVNFTLPESSDYSLGLYDMKGTRVSNLTQGRGVAGQLNTIELDGSALPGGLYLVRLEASGKNSSLKLVLQR